MEKLVKTKRRLILELRRRNWLAVVRCVGLSDMSQLLAKRD